MACAEVPTTGIGILRPGLPLHKSIFEVHCQADSSCEGRSKPYANQQGRTGKRRAGERKDSPKLQQTTASQKAPYLLKQAHRIHSSISSAKGKWRLPAANTELPGRSVDTYSLLAVVKLAAKHLAGQDINRRSLWRIM